MAPQLLFDLSAINLNNVLAGVADIEAVNPHRGHMRLLDGVIWHSDNGEEILAFKNVRDDEFWVAGHIPGRPIFPGVLMIEAGAQLASYMMLTAFEDVGFLGFVGVDGVKFRGQVTPGHRLLVLGKYVSMRRRRCVCDAQGVVDGNLVFEARITGMPI